MNPFLATDGYKTGHHLMYPQGTTLVYSNFTPRSNKHAPKGCEKVVSFGQQMVMKQIKEMFYTHFFNVEKEEVLKTIKEEYSLYLGCDYDVSHIESLWELGYLPIKVKALPEGTEVPMGVPVLTIYNTTPEFYWLTNFLETLISNLLWKPMTSATIANHYRKNLTKWALRTDENNVGFVDFQAHDFSMRGMDSVEATMSSGLGHATSFLGSDGLPVIHAARKYYGEKGGVVYSVNATEHSVMCAGGKEDEIETFRYLMKQFPTGNLSIVSDTWDLWKVLTETLPALKEEIMARDGKIIIRPDSGDPADIVCGVRIKSYSSLDEAEEYFTDELHDSQVHGRTELEIHTTRTVKVGETIYEIEANIEWDRYDKQYYHIEDITYKTKEVEQTPSDIGVIELLWDVFGGTVNEQGFKVLDPHIGAIYGDAITIIRQEDICERLAAKGFASTNLVFGIGSFTYQYNTRDTFGFAMKATYVEIKEHDDTVPFPKMRVVGRPIFKDPVTDDGTKKSAKGLLNVGVNFKTLQYKLLDNVDWNLENEGCLKTIFIDGKLIEEVTLTQIRERIKLLK